MAKEKLGDLTETELKTIESETSAAPGEEPATAAVAAEDAGAPRMGSGRRLRRNGRN